MLEIWPFYTFVPKTTTMWGTVPEILSETHIVILSHFCPFIPLTTLKIKILKKWKMYLEMSSFYRCVIKITVIWCMLSKIWSATDKIFCHFEPFFANLSHSQPEKSKFSKNEKKRLFSEIWSDRQAEFFSHFGPFSSLLPTAPPHPLQPCNIPKKQNFEKMRNTWRYHHFIQVYQNHDHMLYCS